jgi:hypothetical protein
MVGLSYYATVAEILGDSTEYLHAVVAKILLVGPEYFMRLVPRWEMLLSTFMRLMPRSCCGGPRELHAVGAKNLGDGSDAEQLHAVSAKIPVVLSHG